MATVTPWLLVAAGVLLGALVGGAIALFVLRRGGGAGGDATALKGELDDYRREVAEHYAETAKRVDALTHAYKAVYDHLEDGAYRLVGERELRARLEDAESRPVTIEGIGQRVLQRPDDDPEATRRGDGADADGAGSDGAGDARDRGGAPGTASAAAATGDAAPAGAAAGDAGDDDDAGATGDDDASDAADGEKSPAGPSASPDDGPERRS